MDTTPIQKAIDLAGTQAALARAIGAAPAFVNQWVTGRRPVAPKYARAIEETFGVSRHELRPDVFGPAPEGEAA